MKDGGCGSDSSVCPIYSTFLVSYMPCDKEIKKLKKKTMRMMSSIYLLFTEVTKGKAMRLPAYKPSCINSCS